jgi:hypothetical protein
MKRQFAEFERKLATACERIDAEYFQVPVKDAESMYRERVYCYELYHQLRRDWRRFPFGLGGEVYKTGHPLFRDGPYAASKPDLLVHEPGNMEHNLACVEVKPCTGSSKKFGEDLKKLTWFCHCADYHGGIFLVYGNGALEHIWSKVVRAVQSNDKIDLARIHIWTHTAAKQKDAVFKLNLDFGFKPPV